MLEILIIILLILIAIILLFVIIVGIFYTIDLFLEVPYVAAKNSQQSAMITLANIKKGETIIDLGSGDGRLLIASANLGAFAIGYEISPFMIYLSKLKVKLKGLEKQIKVMPTNLWKSDLKVADVIFVYGRRATMKKFQDFVYKNAKKGTRVLVNTNPFPYKKPSLSKDGIYLYIV